MEQVIKNKLESLEADHGVKILFACEGGSRAYGIPSESSDYDVRFIYIRPIGDYLSLEEKKDVLEFPINSHLDMSGWDLKKALQLMLKSNPSLFEWLSTDIVYFKNNRAMEKMSELSNSFFQPRSCIHHYVRMGIGNYEQISRRGKASPKDIINVVRPILMAKWIQFNQKMAPNNLYRLMEETLPENIYYDLGEIIKKKQHGDVLMQDVLMRKIQQYAEKELRVLEVGLKEPRMNTIERRPVRLLDSFFVEMLEDAWDMEIK